VRIQKSTVAQFGSFNNDRVETPTTTTTTNFPVVIIHSGIPLKVLTMNPTNGGHIVNPYARSSSAFLGSNNSLRANEITTTVVEQQPKTTTTATMGIQSQNREGAVRACKKRATRVKANRPVGLMQRSMRGGVGFVSSHHCWQCVNLRLWKECKRSEPKKQHDARCSRNKRTNGLSERTVVVERVAAMNLARNSTPIVQDAVDISNIWPTALFFQPRPTRDNSNQANINNGVERPETNDATVYNDTSVEDLPNQMWHPSCIRQVLENRVEINKTTSRFDDYYKSKYPTMILLAIGYLVAELEHRKASGTNAPLPGTPYFNSVFLKYRKLFPAGNCTFTFPMDSTGPNRPPSPFYDSITGESFVYLDWKMIFPSVPLLCFHCKCRGDIEEDNHLHHDRTNFSKDRSLFPLWTPKGTADWCVIMSYKCLKCKSTYKANDGELLQLLPAYARSIYPVKPRYASGKFHLHQDLTDDLDLLMKTYANPRFISNKMYRKFNARYTDKVASYLSKNPTQDFVSYDEFVGDCLPPSQRLIRDYFEAAENSPLTPYGYSQVERYEREMQAVAVEAGEKIAFDWTFQSIKNYNLPGSKAIFTGNKGSTKEIITLAIVDSTAGKQVSHLIMQMVKKRRIFKPAVLYTDTCPSNDSFWKLLLGDALATKLGLFHLLHRVFDTLDAKCELYWKCLVKLKSSIYSYLEDDEAALIAALKDGSFSKSNQRYSDREIDDLRHSKRWKERYGGYLRKRILPGATIGHNLSKWIDEFKSRTDTTGRPVFSQRTIKVAVEQMKKVKHASDHPGVQMYTRIPPGPRSTHGLSKWHSDRPESPLEKFHELLAHFANTRTNPDLADGLSLGGTTEYNVKCRWKAHVNNRKIESNSPAQYFKIPGHFEDQPRFFDHSYLGVLNSEARRLRLSPIFGFVTPIHLDNGEVFLSKYYKEQKERNERLGQDEKTSMCLCPSCSNNLPIPPSESVAHRGDDLGTTTEVVLEQQQQQQQQNPNFTPNFLPRPLQPRFFAAAMHPPMMSPMMVVQWSNPVDYCFCYPPWYCNRKQSHVNRIFMGQQVLGRPPHDGNCPRRGNNTT
jgi:hypothetical protein